MSAYTRCGFDRRSEINRRICYNVNYFENGGLNRRKLERRYQIETRSGWSRVAKWSSVHIGNYIFPSTKSLVFIATVLLFFFNI